MKRIVIFCALCALWGCKQADAPEMEGIALYYSTSEQSKTDLLSQGDKIGVFSRLEGTEQYFLDNVQFIVGTDGRSLSTTPAVYYPDRKQAVVFYACFPYHTGTFSVPADQTTSLKQADLCWAAASSTPVAAAVPLEFTHKMARLLVTTNTPTTKIAIPNAFSGGTLDIRTGVFTNTTQATLSTTGTELILPAQTLSRLVLTVSGVEYVFAPVTPITLTEAHTTSLSLALNPTQKTATLSGSSTTNWTSSATQGNPTQAVSNVLTIHWPNYVPQGATPDKVTLTINNTDYTVSSGITNADQTFTVPFASSVLRYPYTISKITFPNLPSCTQLLGATIYKSAASTLGIKDQANIVKIGNLWWTIGNLVANGPNGCRIGNADDYGLYFAYASLVGWSGGANGDGTGQGSPALALKVKPADYTGTTAYPGGYLATSSVGTGYYYPATDNAQTGIGDPCRFYLGSPWTTPTSAQWRSVRTLGASGWTTHDGAKGAWLGPTPHTTAKAIFAPASGILRNGMPLTGVATHGRFTSYDDRNQGAGVYHFNPVAANTWSDTFVLFTEGIPARCVRPI